MIPDNFQLFRDVVNCTCGLRLFRIPATDQGTLELLNNSLFGIIKSISYPSMFLSVFRNMEAGHVYEVCLDPGIHYLVVCDELREFFLVLGGCKMKNVNNSSLDSFIRRTGMKKEAAEDVQALLRNLPVVDSGILHQLGTLLAEHVANIPTPVPYQYLDYRWDEAGHNNMVFEDHFDELFRMRQIEQRYEYSSAMTEAVKQGNLSLAYHFAQLLVKEGGELNRSPDSFRNAQNMCIILNTQLHNAMEEIGVHPYRLDRFFGNIALQIERFRKTEDVFRYMLEIVRRYTELSQEVSYGGLKQFSRLVVLYIKEHLSDSVSVREAAQALTVNSNYLSSQFHREVGVTFTEFVNRERVRQAAALLKHTNLQIQQIAASVGYNHTSYFAKQFLKYYGVTPRAYRQTDAVSQWDEQSKWM